MELSGDGGCLFTFNEQAPADAEYMAGVMAHEVAHAYRAHHRLVGETSRSEEEWLTDLTTSYLGFGLFAANISYRYRTEGGWGYQAWTSRATGYLTPQAFAYLLAIQIVARDLDATEQRRLLKHLEANQAAFTKEAIQVVLGRRIDVVERIRADLGASSHAFVPPEEVLRPLPAYVRPEPIAEGDSGEPAETEIGQSPVFRAPKNRLPLYLPLGLVVGSLLGTVTAYLVDQPLLALVGLFGGTILGVVLGERACFEVCSNRCCGAVLGPADTCPGCGAYIAGSLREALARAAAEEESESGSAVPPEGPPVAHKIRRAARSKNRPT